MTKTLSFSQIETFMQCERRWYYERIEKRARPDNVYFQAGNYFHALCEQWFRPHDAPPTPAQFVEVGLRAHILKAYERLRDEFLKDVTPRSDGIERRFRTPGWTGKIDLIAETGPPAIPKYPTVIDFKTLHKPKWRARDAGHSPQLALYCLETGVMTAAFVEVNLWPPYENTVTAVTFSPEILERWRRWLDGQRTALLSRGPDIGNYRLAAPGDPLCSPQWCPHFDFCAGGNGNKEKTDGV